MIPKEIKNNLQYDDEVCNTAKTISIIIVIDLHGFSSKLKKTKL